MQQVCGPVSPTRLAALCTEKPSARPCRTWCSSSQEVVPITASNAASRCVSSRVQPGASAVLHSSGWHRATSRISCSACGTVTAYKESIWAPNQGSLSRSSGRRYLTRSHYARIMCCCGQQATLGRLLIEYVCRRRSDHFLVSSYHQSMPEGQQAIRLQTWTQILKLKSPSLVMCSNPDVT